jgi:hypothetical protein
MKTFFARTACALICALATSGFVHAQTSDSGQQAPRATPAPASDEAPYVTSKGFATKMFTVVNRDPRLLIPALRLLGSGFKGALIESSTELRTITVRDFPENVASIEEAIKVLDKPEPPQATIELRLHVLLASNSAVLGEPVPQELDSVITQLKSTLRYTNYTLVTSVIQRTKSGSYSIWSEGLGRFLPAPSPEAARWSRYQYRIENIALDPDAGAGSAGAIVLRKFAFDVSDSVSGPVARMQTDLNLRDGEKIVVGTAGIVDRGLVLVLSAKVVK